METSHLISCDSNEDDLEPQFDPYSILGTLVLRPVVPEGEGRLRDETCEGRREDLARIVI